MKFEIEAGGATLLLRAETPADLDYLESMKGVHQPGPWAKGEFIKMPSEDLGFDPAGAGWSWVDKDGRITATLGAVRLRADWLVYKEPPSPAMVSRQNVALRIGHGLLDALELLQGQRPD